MRIDRDNIEEILITISRNKTRSALTAFGVFWGIFMLVFMLGGGHGMKNILARELSGVANNSGFVFSSRTTVPYKGFRKGRRWDIDMKDLEAMQRIPELEVVAANNSRWGKTFIFEEKIIKAKLLSGIFKTNNRSKSFTKRNNILFVFYRKKFLVSPQRRSSLVICTK